MVGESLLIKLAEKVADKIFEELTGKTISNFLEDKKERNAFKKAIIESFQALAKKGFKVGRSGALYKEFFLDKDVIEELWLKVVDPAYDEEIDFDLLEKKFKECWKSHVDINKTARDGITYFCDRLDAAIYRRAELYDLLNTKRLREARDWISLGEIERLKEKCLKHIRKTKENEFLELLGEGNDYVEPALERKAEDPPREGIDLDFRLEEKKAGAETRFSPISVAEVVRSDRSDYVLISESGMGKTTFLKWLELSISKGELSKDYLPIYIHLFNLKDYTTQDQLISYLATEFSKVVDDRKLKQFIKVILKQGGFLFLLDGLDQVSDLSVIPEQLEKKRIYADSKIIIATRQTGYGLISSQLRNYKFIQLVPFDQKRIEKYLKERVENPKVKEIIRQNRELVRIPILLQMISSLLGEDAEGPSEIKTRSHLYERFINHLFAHEKEVKITRLSPEKRKLDLQKLSYDLIDRGFWGSFPEREGYKSLQESELNVLLEWGILNRIIERAKSQIGFRHQSFQEYFASTELKDRIFKDGEIEKEQFEKHLEYKKWDQSFLFLVGLLDENSAKKLILKIRKYDPFFAGLCVSHYGGKSEDFTKIIKGLFAFSEKGFVHQSFAVLSSIGSQMILNRLIQTLNCHKVDLIRIVAAMALGKIGDRKAVDPLINALRDKNVGWAAAEALGKIGDQKTVDLLRDILKGKDKYAIWAAAKALGKISDQEAVDFLINILSNKDAYSRWVAVVALQEIGDPKGVDALVEVLEKDKDEAVKRAAVSALGAIGDSKVVDPLIKASKDKDSLVRADALWTLGKIGDSRCVDLLIEALNHDKFVRGSAADALGEIRDPKAVEPLIEALKDEDKYVKSAAVEALGKIGEPKALNHLIDALNDEHTSVRLHAAEALGKIGGLKAVNYLIEVLKDESEVVRRYATEALGKIGDQRTVKLWLEALKDEDEIVRWDTAVALTKIVGHETLLLRLKSYGKRFLAQNKDLIGFLFEKAPRRYLNLGLKYWGW